MTTTATAIRRAVVYCRISLDSAETEAGIERQKERGEALAGDNDWELLPTLIDNDRSGTSTRGRQAFAQLRSLIEEEAVDVVIVQHADRIARNITDAFAFYQLCDDHGVQIEAWGGLSPGVDADSFLPSGVEALFADYYSRVLGSKQKARHDTLRAEGRWSGGKRPFAYRVASNLPNPTEEELEAGLVIDPEEAEVLRQMARRYARGDSVNGMITWLREAGIRGTRGADFTSQSLQRLLTNPVVTGRRDHGSPKRWEAVIDDETFQLCVARDKARQRRPRKGRPRAWLGSGLLSCGKCGTALVSGKSNGLRGYRCPRQRGGCGGTFITAQPADGLIRDIVITALAAAGIEERIAATAGDAAKEKAGRLAVEVTGIEEQRLSAAELYGEGTIDAAQLATISRKLDERKAAASARLTALGSAGRSLPEDSRPGADIEVWWEEATVEQRRQLTGFIIESVTVLPGLYERSDGTRGQRSIMERLKPIWAA